MRFIIFYGDGSIYEGENFVEACQASTADVQLIAQAHPEATLGRYLLHSKPYYIWLAEGMWSAADEPGFWDYLFQQGPKSVLFGRTMANDSAFHEIVKRAEKVRF